MKQLNFPEALYSERFDIILLFIIRGYQLSLET